MFKRLMKVLTVLFILTGCIIFIPSMDKVYADTPKSSLFPDYSLRDTLNEVPEDKIFTLTFNNDVNIDSASDGAIELIESTTTDKIAVKVSLAGENKVIVTPQEKLKIGHTYYLVVHNKIKSTQNQSMKQGVVFTIRTVPQSEIDFINAVVAGAQKTYEEYGIFPSVTIAQAILESGWGTSDKANLCNNLFGIKADSSWLGKKMDLPTQEWDGNQMVTVTASWRAYDDWAASIEDHGNNLVLKATYSKNGVFKATNYKEQITAMKKAGYATDPNYVEHICSIIERLQLWKYDPNGKIID